MDEAVFVATGELVKNGEICLDEAFRKLAQITTEKHVGDVDAERVAANLILQAIRHATPDKFSSAVDVLYGNIDPSGRHRPLVAEAFRDFVVENASFLDDLADEFAPSDLGLSVFALSTLERAYLLRNSGGVVERPCYMYLRVAIVLGGDDGLEGVRRIYELVVTRKCSFATPVMFNAGCSKNPNLASCFLYTMTKDQDSIDGIFSSLHDCAKISHVSGGIGISMHDVRARGSPINGGAGKAQGLMPVMQLFNTMAQTVDQGGGKRRGSIAVYLEPHHPDLLEFLESRMTYGSQDSRTHDLFTALWVSDLFMKRVEADAEWSLFCPNLCPGLSDVWGEDYENLYAKYEREGRAFKTMKARDVFYKIIDLQMNASLPYVLFKDACNAKSNQQNLGTIRSSNLCVAGETMILTKQGYYPIQELVGQSVQVWNGTAWSDTTPVQTGVDQELLTVSFSNGMELKCTPYHKFYVETGRRPAERSVPIVVEAKDLQEGMKFIRFDLSQCDHSEREMSSPYTHGFFCADGTYEVPQQKVRRCTLQNEKAYEDDGKLCCATAYKPHPELYLYGEKRDLIEYIEHEASYENVSSQRLDFRLCDDIEPKFFVPLEYSLNTKLRWLEGYLDGDGCILRNNGIKNVQAASIHLDFLRQVLLLLQTLGVYSSIGVVHESTWRKMPDGKGGKKEYECKKTYRLGIDATGLQTLISLGFAPKRLDISNGRLAHHKTNPFVKVEKIMNNGERGDTFCFNEALEHKGTFNGVLTGQCSEVVLYSSQEETAVCILASVCLPRFIKNNTDASWRRGYDFNDLHKVAYHTAVALDSVIDKTHYPVESAKRSSLRHRPIGIGTQGLADCLASFGLSWGSAEALEFDEALHATLYHAAILASSDLAAIHGSYESFRGSPASEGLLQFDLWGQDPYDLSLLFDDSLQSWQELKHKAMRGLRNSTSIALMPTASTAQIAGNSETIEPYTANLFSRGTLSGEYIVVNQSLRKLLTKKGQWNPKTIDQMIRDKGSVQGVSCLSPNEKDVFRTAWEIRQKHILQHSAIRSKYVCQSTSLNIHLQDPTREKMTSLHFLSWKLGLKTSTYYLRLQSTASALQFAVNGKDDEEEPACTSCSA